MSAPAPAHWSTRARTGRWAAILAALAVVVALGACDAPSEPEPGPVTTTDPTPAQRAAALVATLSDDDLVGQVIMPAVTFGDPEGAAALVREFRVAGVILMPTSSRGHSAAEAQAMTDAIRAVQPQLGAGLPDLLIGADQEYGFVTRITSGMTQLPAAMALGAAARAELTRSAWSGVGQELAALGINVDFAPDADVLSSPGNTTIGSRSFGADAVAVGEQAAAAVTGLQTAGVAATLKHFPGHGDTAVDSHTDLPVLRQSRERLDSTDLVPFRAGIAAGVQLVMIGHLDVSAIDPGVPATFSHKVVTDVLRGELGFQGVAVTDALNMAPAQRLSPADAAVRALLAGNDLLLMPPDVAATRTGLSQALASGQLPRARLVEAATRVLTLRFSLARGTRPDPSTVDSQEHRNAAAAVAAAAVTVLSGPCTGPLVAGPVRVTTAAGRDQAGQWLSAALTALGVPVVSEGGSQVHLVGRGDGAEDLAPGAAVTVAMDTPYLLASADSPVRVATYSSTEVAMHALAAVVAGQAQATGRAPVAVSGLPASACR